MSGGLHEADGYPDGPGVGSRPPLPAFAPIGFAETMPSKVPDPVPEETPPVAPAALASIVVAGLLVAIWTAFFVWSQSDTTRLDPRTVSALIAQWATPVLLIGVVWLLAASSGRRAMRIGRDGRALAEQASLLEARLTGVNRELSLAREFVAAQSRDLESTGRLAVERLSESGAHIQQLVQTNAGRIETIAAASRVALDNMEQLRAQLPVLTSSTRDLANTIGSAGQSGQAQLAEVHQGLAKIAEAGAENAVQIDALRRSADAALVALHARTETLRQDGERIATLLREHEAVALDRWREAAARTEADIGAALVVLDNAERDAFATSHQRLVALSDDAERIDALLDERSRSFTAAVAERRRAVAEADDQAVVVFAKRLEDLDAELAARQAAQVGMGETLTGHGEALVERLGQTEARLMAIVAQGRDARDTLGAHVRDLIAALADGRETLTGVDGDMRALITSSERVRDLLASVARQTSEELPPVLTAGEVRLQTLLDAIVDLRTAIGEAGDRGDAVASGLTAAAADALARLGEIGERQTRASADAVAHLGHLDAIDERLREIADAGERLTDQARDDFTEALAAIVRDMTTTGATAFDRALRNAAAETAGRVEQAAAHAAGVSSEAAVQLRAEIALVDRQTAALEARIAASLARTETSLDRDFAHRAALITETLNSNAIDIASALARDLPDTAWAAYLRGDRGVFTRRAVRLLDGGQSRAILTLYETEPSFRDNVSRYIHDFEAILRELLAARDGHVLAVTMLSSDLGKLYVALAQAIERLRN